MAVLGTFFLTRELEMASAAASHFTMNCLAGEITWDLPVSKTDTRALGATRTWGCTCAGDVNTPCPYHAAFRQFDKIRNTSNRVGIPLSGMPMFPTIERREITKAASVETIEELAKRAGLSVVTSTGAKKYGGHSLRTGGAAMLHAVGVSTDRIESLARWSSPMLLYYIRQAPARGVTSEYILQRRRKESPEGGLALQQSAKLINKTLRKLCARIESMEEAFGAREKLIKSLEDQQWPKIFVCNLSSMVWHMTRSEPSAYPCATNCGWQFTSRVARVEAQLPARIDSKSICGTCLPWEKWDANTD